MMDGPFFAFVAVVGWMYASAVAFVVVIDLRDLRRRLRNLEGHKPMDGGKPTEGGS